MQDEHSPPEAQISEIDPRSEQDELKDKLLRALAEVENVKRRGQRDVEDMAKYAKAEFAKDLLVVSDNLHRALQSMPSKDDMKDDVLRSVAEGISMTEKELHRVFEKHGLQKVKTEKFDHNVHQAMFETPHETLPSGTIIEVLQDGYKMHDRLLRPAMVGVAK